MRVVLLLVLVVLLIGLGTITVSAQGSNGNAVQQIVQILVQGQPDVPRSEYWKYQDPVSFAVRDLSSRTNRKMEQIAVKSVTAGATANCYTQYGQGTGYTVQLALGETQYRYYSTNQGYTHLCETFDPALKAKQHLAGQLGVSPNLIMVVGGPEPRNWETANLGCSTQPILGHGGTMPGWFVRLKYNNYIYDYRVDMNYVIPCGGPMWDQPAP